MKRLYYCKECKDADVGLYIVAHSHKKAKAILWASGWCDGEYISFVAHVLPKYDKVIAEYPLGEFEDFDGIGMDTSHWDW